MVNNTNALINEEKELLMQKIREIELKLKDSDGAIENGQIKNVQLKEQLDNIETQASSPSKLTKGHAEG